MQCLTVLGAASLEVEIAAYHSKFFPTPFVFVALEDAGPFFLLWLGMQTEMIIARPSAVLMPAAITFLGRMPFAHRWSPN